MADQEYNFEPFAETPEYIVVNTRIIRYWINKMLRSGSEKIESILDAATGTGTIAEMVLISLPDNWPKPRVYCLDKSEEALALAKANLENGVEELHLIHSSIEEMEKLDREMDIVTWGNGIHYLDSDTQKQAISKIHEVLAPGGRFFFNTAFYDGARPEETSEFYNMQMFNAVRCLREQGFARQKKDLPPKMDFFSPEHYRELLEECGFSGIEMREFSARLYQTAWEYISEFSQYAAGALRGYPVEKAAQALRDAVGEAIEKHGKEDERGNKFITRNWLAVSAQKI